MGYGYKRTALCGYKQHSGDKDKVSLKGGGNRRGSGKPEGEGVQRGQTDL